MSCKTSRFQKKMIMAALAVFTLLLCAKVVRGNLKTHSVLEEETSQLYPEYFTGIEDSGYDGNGGFWQTGEDPQLHFNGMDQEIQGVLLELSEPCDQERSFQVFWSDGQVFGKKQFSDGMIRPGETQGTVAVKKGRWSHLRIDIDGDYNLKSVRTSPNAKTRYYLDKKGAGNALKRCLLIVTIMLLAGIAHLERMKKNGRYLPSLFGQSGGREGVYDYLRIMATLMVIVGHVLQSDIGRAPEGGWKYGVMSMVFVFCAGCNPLYVMLSGALLLPFKEEKPGAFYVRRLAKVALPMAVYFGVYLYLNRVVTDLSWESIKLFFTRLISGYTPEAPHYWLIYTLLSLYVLVPFFRRMLKNMDYSQMTGMAIVILAVMAAETYLPMLLGGFSISTFLASWPGAMLLGYWITRPETRRYDGLLMAAGAAGFFLTVMIVLLRADYKETAVNCSFSMILTICGVFAFCLHFRRLFVRRGRLLMFFSKYSYSIILIHWAALFFFTKEKLHLYGDMGKVVGGTALAAAATLAASAVAAFVIDNTVLAAAELLYDKLVGIVGRRRR